MKKQLTLILMILAAFVFLSGQKTEILSLKEKIIDIQNEGELGFTDFTLCSKIFGFAYYVPLNDNIIDKNGTLLVYYEPTNVYTSKRDGMYEIWYTQDMVLMQEDGTVINEWEDILSFKYTSKKPVLDLFAENTIDLKGQLPSGKYKFKAILKDKLGEKTAEKIIDFQVK